MKYAVEYDGKGGGKYFLCDEPEGWVDATGSPTSVFGGELPDDIKVFDSALEADKFMAEWEGHPHYALPVPDSWAIFEVEPVMTQTAWRKKA